MQTINTQTAPLTNQLILAVDSEDGYVSPLFVSHPSSTIDDFHSDWKIALDTVKNLDSDEWCVNDVYEYMNAQFGYSISYGEPSYNIRVEY